MGSAGAAERRLAAIVESSDDAIIAKDLDGIVLSWNDGARRMYGYGAAEIIGQSVAKLIPEGHREELESILEKIRRGERIASHETVRIRKDGAQIDVSVTVSPIYGRQGEVIGASAIARDVSERRRAEAARQVSDARWRAVFEAAVDGIIVIDATGRIDAVNPAAERLFGYRAEEVAGCNVNMLMPSPYRDEHDRYLAHYLETGERRVIGIGRDVAGLKRDGTTFPLHLSVGESHSAGKRIFIGLLHDLSERVRGEQHLREQAALAKIGEMAAVLAHEVKNPLAAVSGAIQIIADVLPPDCQERMIVTEILARLDTLNELTNDLLLFARPPRPSLASFDIALLLRSTTDLLAADQAHADLDIEVSGAGLVVLGDIELLKIVLLNLMLNASHAMNGRGKVRIGVAEAGDLVRITVADAGPGVPPENRSKLFEPFFTTKTRGTGLGLSTAKRLIEAQQGTIEMSWPASGGTTVTVHLPRAPEREGSEEHCWQRPILLV